MTGRRFHLKQMCSKSQWNYQAEQPLALGARSATRPHLRSESMNARTPSPAIINAFTRRFQAI
jgi:hypothetical protein